MSNPPGPPPIPEIGGDVDLLLDVYTHGSLRHLSNSGPAQMNEEYGDKDRLAELGANALDLAVTQYLYALRPLLNVEDMQVRKIAITSDSNLDLWLGAYRMKEKLRVAAAEAHILNDPVEMRKYFNTFLGAVYIRSGLPTIQDWISALIDWSPPVIVDVNHVQVDTLDGGDASGENAV